MPGFFASRVLQPVSPHPGESGYFSSPVDSLDPRLFDGETFRPEVRTWVTNTLYDFWGDRYHRPKAWSTVWVAGSGISYQWAAGRGNGDLDILIGVDFPAFFAANPKFAGMPEEDMAAVFNAEFHSDLWPLTAHTQISAESAPVLNGVNDVFEVTFYVNPKSVDIRNIHPYAAYDLTHDAWTVRPPTGESFNHPQEYFDAAERENQAAQAIINRYNQAVSHPGPNSVHAALLAASQAAQMYEDIHLGRKNAFSDQGKGYGDYYNFRWQFHKNSGMVQTLHEVAQAHKDAHEEYADRTYGGSIDAADVALRRASLWNRGGNGRK